MTGVSWRPPPAPAGWASAAPAAGRWRGRALRGCRPSAWGGEAAERMGGDGAWSRSRIAGSGGRAGLRPAVTGRVADGAGPMKTTGHVGTESTEDVVHLWA